MSKDGDRIRITAERVYLSADPSQGLDLIPDSEVTGNVNVIRGQESCSPRRSGDHMQKIRVSFMSLFTNPLTELRAEDLPKTPSR